MTILEQNWHTFEHNRHFFGAVQDSIIIELSSMIIELLSIITKLSSIIGSALILSWTQTHGDFLVVYYINTGPS